MNFIIITTLNFMEKLSVMQIKNKIQEEFGIVPTGTKKEMIEIYNELSLKQKSK